MNPDQTLSTAYAEPNPANERKRLESVAAGWTPKAQAEYVNYQRMQSEGATLSPGMQMQLGYLTEAKTAHEALNGK
jgi:hypothetical protein